MNNGEFQAYTEQIEQWVRRVNDLPDEEARNSALALLQAMMDLHGAVLARMVEVLTGAGESGRSALAKLGRDPLVCGLLVLYDAHPLGLEARVAGALDRVRPQLRKQGGSAELLGISGGVARLKLSASGHGCGHSADALKQMAEQAILEVAPEIDAVQVEGPPPSASEPSFVPLSTIHPLQEKESTR